MQEKKNHHPTQNIHMMRSKSRKYGFSVNIVTRSGIAIGEDKVVGKKLEENPWVHKATDKENEFNFHKAKEKFMDTKTRFVDSGASTSKHQSAWTEKSEEVIDTQETYPSVLTSFLQTCMKFLSDQISVEGLQKLIDNCTGKGKSLPKQCVVHKVDKSKKRMGWEMRSSAQIEEFEMD